MSNLQDVIDLAIAWAADEQVVPHADPDAPGSKKVELEITEDQIGFLRETVEGLSTACGENVQSSHFLGALLTRMQESGIDLTNCGTDEDMQKAVAEWLKQ